MIQSNHVMTCWLSRCEQAYKLCDNCGTLRLKRWKKNLKSAGTRQMENFKAFVDKSHLNGQTLGFNPQLHLPLYTFQNDRGHSRTHPSDVCNSCHHLVNAAFLELVIRTITRLDLNLSTFSPLTNKLDPHWSIGVGNFAQLKMNCRGRKLVCLLNKTFPFLLYKNLIEFWYINYT